MRKWILISFMIMGVGILSFSFVVNDFTEPSAFSRAIGGAIYPLYEGAQSVTYNPAGISNDENEMFFSHVEHFLGVIRNEFLSAAINLGKISFTGAVQYTHPIDELIYDQYKFTGGAAYSWGKNSIGIEMNSWKGTDIEGGFSLDAGAIFNYENMNFGLTVKNLFSNITTDSTSSTNESYSPEWIISEAYFASHFVASTYLNFNSEEAGIGVIVPVSNFFKVLGGYRIAFGKAISNELSVGMRAFYYNFTLDVSYVFKDPIQYGDSISPFYISLTYDFPKGM